MYTVMMAEPAAFLWVCLQKSLMQASNRVEAYAHDINDCLHFCYQSGILPIAAGRELLALYVNHLSTT